MQVFRMGTGTAECFDVENGSYSVYKHKLFINNLCSILSDGKLYLSGFDAPSDRVYTFDTRSRAISRLSDMNVPRKSHSFLLFESRILALGGVSGITKQSSCEEFIDSDWEMMPPMNRQRANHSATAICGAVYVFGDTIDASIEVYRDRKWTLLDVKLRGQTLNTGIFRGFENSLFIVGGGAALVGYNSNVYEFLLDEEHIQQIGEITIGDSFKGNICFDGENQYLIGGKGLHCYNGEFTLYSNKSHCKKCRRWRCDGKCEFIRRKILIMLRIKLPKIVLV